MLSRSLFSIFINDALNEFSAERILFAYNINSIHAAEHVANAAQLFSENLDLLEK